MRLGLGLTYVTVRLGLGLTVRYSATLHRVVHASVLPRRTPKLSQGELAGTVFVVVLVDPYQLKQAEKKPTAGQNSQPCGAVQSGGGGEREVSGTRPGVLGIHAASFHPVLLAPDAV